MRSKKEIQEKLDDIKENARLGPGYKYTEEDSIKQSTLEWVLGEKEEL